MNTLRHLRRPSFLKRGLLVVLALVGLGGVVLVTNPASVLGALRRVSPGDLLLVVLLTLAFYALQGLRWHQLLRCVGARSSLRHHQLMNLAGQTMTAVVPLGDLTRALLASRAADVPFGAVAATVTVQELSYMLLVVLVAIPGVLRLPGGVVLAALLLLGIAAVVVILTVSRIFSGVRRGIAAVPGLRRMTGELDALQQEASRLLRNRRVAAGAVLELGRVVIAATSLLLIVRGLHIASLSWSEVALVFAVSCIGGALSLLPGGVGANEASVVGVLVALGVEPAAAAAVAIIQRMSLTLVPAAGGALAYLALRHMPVGRPTSRECWFEYAATAA